VPDETGSSAVEQIKRKAGAKRKVQLFTTTAAELLQTKFPPIDYVIPGYIAEGLTVLAGRPKVGKSWMALDFALAVSLGGVALASIKVSQGDVLYLGLEDNARRLQRRIDQLAPTGALPARLHLATECPRLDKGGIDAIEDWCDRVNQPRLIVVDVFGQVRPENRQNDSLYDSDYRALSPLKQLADRRHLAVLVLHHTNKRDEPEDRFDAVSGTTGFTGAADTVLILAKGPQGPTLYGRGRDIEEVETALRFEPKGQWIALGEAGDVRRTDERKAILDALLEAEEPLSPTTIATATGMKYLNVRRLLGKMVTAGEVMKLKRAQYCHPSHRPSDTCHGDNGHMVT
jgi:RecA-family ATPase